MLAIVACLGVLLSSVFARADTAAGEDEKYYKAFDAAVDGALEYLAKTQYPDGSFPGPAMKCNAVTAVCIMAFLARGYSPGLGPYGEVVNRGIDSVLSTQQPDGTLIGGGGGAMYSHNIATLMLSEVSGMVDPERQKRIDQVLSKALQVILAAQKVNKPEAQKGGWRYGPASADSDMSHSGWATMALRSARNNGTPVPKEAIDDAMKFIKNCRAADGSFGYQPGGGGSMALTGAGLLCLELGGYHRTELTLKTGQYISNAFKNGWPGGYFYYGIYYCSQGMFQLGDKEWQEFAPKMYESLLKLQGPDGSWQNAPGASDENAGPCFRTGMAVLALSVSYRQLPIYQR
jgi:hypothetical protein